LPETLPLFKAVFKQLGGARESHPTKMGWRTKWVKQQSTDTGSFSHHHKIWPQIYCALLYCELSWLWPLSGDPHATTVLTTASASE